MSQKSKRHKYKHLFIIILNNDCFLFCELRARAMAQSSAKNHGVTQRDNDPLHIYFLCGTLCLLGGSLCNS